MHSLPRNVKCFSVSLKSSPRRARFASAMHSSGIEFEFFDAVDGRELSESELNGCVDHYRCRLLSGKILSKSEVGCSLSHLHLYSKLVSDSESSHYLIFEDDASPKSGLLEAVISAVESDADIVSFYSECAVVRSNQVLELNKVIAQKVYSRCDNTVCYLIAKNAAKKILKITNGMVCGVADWPFIPEIFSFYLSCNNLVLHNNSESTIAADRPYQSQKGRSSILYAILLAVSVRNFFPVKNWVVFFFLPSLLRRGLGVADLKLIEHR